MKRALITGISGQDGSYLAEYLLGLGEIYGLIRLRGRSSWPPCSPSCTGSPTVPRRPT